MYPYAKYNILACFVYTYIYSLQGAADDYFEVGICKMYVYFKIIFAKIPGIYLMLENFLCASLIILKLRMTMQFLAV